MKFFSGSLGGTSTVLQRIGQHPYILLAIIIALLCVVSIGARALQDPAVIVLPESNTTAANTNSSKNIDVQVNASNTQETSKESNANIPSVGLVTPAQQSVELTVNGQEIPVPNNGTVTTNVGNDSSTTTITVQSSSSTSGTSTDRSKLRIKASTRTTESVTNRSTSQVTEEGVLQP